MGISAQNSEYTTKIKQLFSIEKGIQQCQLSGKLQYSAVSLFKAEKTKPVNSLDNENVKIANMISIPTDHFGLIQYIVKHWHLCGKVFEMGNFDGVSQLKSIAQKQYKYRSKFLLLGTVSVLMGFAYFMDAIEWLLVPIAFL